MMCIYVYFFTLAQRAHVFLKSIVFLFMFVWSNEVMISLLHPQVYVQPHFDYNPANDNLIPCKEAGLAFERGDVLQIVNREDPNWWQVSFAIEWQRIYRCIWNRMLQTHEDLIGVTVDRTSETPELTSE